MSTDTLLFECVGLKAGGKFPIGNTGRGQDVSPEFLVENLSPAAKTLAVTIEMSAQRHKRKKRTNPNTSGNGTLTSIEKFSRAKRHKPAPASAL